MTRNPTVGSVFTGIGGFDLGFQRAGFDMAWMCEREPFCRTVLAERFAGVPCFEDVTTLAHPPHVDVLVGGFPCQDVSVAGQRRGLAGERTGLFWELMRLVDVLKPQGVVLENVPGLLSSHGGRDFHTVLSALAERGLRRSYRILDSQHFGVPQRRRRVFLVCGVGGFGERTETVLFESTSRSRDSQARSEARARTAACLRGRSSRAGVNEPGRGGEDDQNLITFGWNKSPSQTMRVDSETTNAVQASATSNPAVAFTLPSAHRGVGNGHNTNYIAATLNSGGNSGGFRTEPGEHLIASLITASAGHHGHSSPRGDGRDNLIARPLKSGGNDRQDESHETYINGGGVRRLTPLECERLQGFPDGWTCLCGNGHRGSAFCTCHDTPRYKALGNAVTVNVAEWIARRMMEAGRLTS